MDNFTITGGSVIGADHIYYGFNNQDAFSIVETEDRIVGCVFDGCGSSPRSEYGSIFAAQWFPQYVSGLNFQITDLTELSVKICRKLIHLMDIMGVRLEDRNEALANYFLFTILGFVIEKEYTYIFGAGDGVYSINNEHTMIDPDEGKGPDEPENAPNYVAYKLIGMDGDLRLHKKIETNKIKSLIVGTDGLEELERKRGAYLRDGKIQGGIDQFTEPKYCDPTKKKRLQKRLNVIGKRNDQLKDDTTLIVVSRQDTKPCES